MSTEADQMFPEVGRVFAPPLYEDAALKKIKKHLGKRANVALHGKKTQDYDREVIEALNRFADLQEMSKLGQVEGFVGKKRVKDQIDIWLERRARYTALKRSQGVAHHPEMFDEMGDYQGPGTDRGRPRKYDLALFEGREVSLEDFTKDLIPEGPAAKGKPDHLMMFEGENFVKCPICVHQESWEESTDRTQRASARARMAKHMKGAKKKKDQHLLAHKANFVK